MSKSILMKSTLIATIALSTQAYAFEIDKHPVTSVATVTSAALTSKEGAQKQVTLMNFKLSTKEKQNLFQRLSTNKYDATLATVDKLPSKIDLGMNRVPVLDQGRHGSCVTFAVTAALDAELGKGDYISQLCN